MEQNKPLAHHPQLPDSTMLRSHQLTVTGPMLMAGHSEPTGAQAMAIPTAGGLWQAFKRCWLKALPLGLAAAALAAVAIFLAMPGRFVAVAGVQVNSNASKSFLTDGFGQDDPDFTIFKSNIQVLVKSPMLLRTAVNRLESKNLSMAQDPAGLIEFLKSGIKTDFRQGPEIMQVTLAGDDPKEIAQILDTVIETLFTEVKERETKVRDTSVQELEKNRNRAENELRQKKIALKSALEIRKMKDPEVLKILFSNAIKIVEDVKKELRVAQSELTRARDDLQTLLDREVNQPFVSVPESLLDQELEKSPEGKAFADELNKVVKDIQQIRAVVPNPDQFMASYLDKRDAAQRRLDEARKALRPKLEAKIRRDQADQIKTDLVLVKERIRSLQGQTTILKDDVEKAEKEADAYNPAKQHWAPEVQSLMDECARSEMALGKLNERIVLIKNEPPKPSRVTWWLKPEPPQAKDYSKQVKFAGVGAFGLFACVLLGFSLYEFRTLRIHTPEELSKTLGLHVVGTLPKMPEAARRNNREGVQPKDLAWQNQLNEAVDSIRTMLLHSARTDNLHVVMISSALSGEGKTSLASQLAASLARVWRKTLLIDGDLRNPANHELFGMGLEPGFSEVLRGEVSAQDVIRPTPLSRLWLMPAGQWDNHAIQALSQDSLRSLFEGLKQQYDFLIIDSSPLLPVADSLALAQHVDGVIFAILRDVSRAPSVQLAQEKLNNLGIRTLGAVLIGAKNELGFKKDVQTYAAATAPKETSTPK